jgi:hypothetical protein
MTGVGSNELIDRPFWIDGVLAGVLGTVLMWAALATWFDTRRYRNTWRHAVGPATVLTLLWLAALPLAHATRLLGAASGWTTTTPREVSAKLTTPQLTERLDTWARHHGYVAAGGRFWNVQRVSEDGLKLAAGTVAVRRFAPSSNLARWGIGRGLVYQVRPPLVVTSVSLDDDPQAFLSIETGPSVAPSPAEAAVASRIDALVSMVEK